MQYEEDGLTVVYAGPWLGGEDGGDLESAGIADVSELAAEHAGKSFGFVLSVYWLPEVQHQVRSWQANDWRAVFLAYLLPITDMRVRFVVVRSDAALTNPGEVLAPLDEIAQLENRIGGPDWMERLKDVTDAVRVKLTPGDTLVLRMDDKYTPNQLRELQDSLTSWFEATYGERYPVLVIPGEALSVLELPEPDIDPERPQEARTRVGGTWVLGHVPEAQARVQATALHQEQLEYARQGLKEAKTATVEWWRHGERLDGPPAEVA